MCFVKLRLILILQAHTLQAERTRNPITTWCSKHRRALAATSPARLCGGSVYMGVTACTIIPSLRRNLSDTGNGIVHVSRFEGAENTKKKTKQKTKWKKRAERWGWSEGLTTTDNYCRLWSTVRGVLMPYTLVAPPSTPHNDAIRSQQNDDCDIFIALRTLTVEKLQTSSEPG
jgi:hypothetical protein